MSTKRAASSALGSEESTDPKQQKLTPKKRPSNSVLQEGEAYLKQLGFNSTEGETTGRRRTRAAAKGIVYAPPPKRATRATGTAGRRGRPSKKSKLNDSDDDSKEEMETDDAPDEEKLVISDNKKSNEAAKATVEPSTDMKQKEVSRRKNARSKVAEIIPSVASQPPAKETTISDGDKTEATIPVKSVITTSEPATLPNEVKKTTTSSSHKDNSPSKVTPPDNLSLSTTKPSVNSPTKPSVTTSPVKPSVTTSPVKPSETDSPVKPSETDSPVKPSETDSPVKPSETDSPVKPSETDSPVKPSVTDSPVKPSETGSPAKLSETGSPAKLSETASIVKPSVTALIAKPFGNASPVKITVASSPTKPAVSTPSILTPVKLPATNPSMNAAAKPLVPSNPVGTKQSLESPAIPPKPTPVAPAPALPPKPVTTPVQSSSPSEKKAETGCPSPFKMAFGSSQSKSLFGGNVKPLSLSGSSLFSSSKNTSDVSSAPAASAPNVPSSGQPVKQDLCSSGNSIKSTVAVSSPVKSTENNSTNDTVSANIKSSVSSNATPDPRTNSSQVSSSMSAE